MTSHIGFWLKKSFGKSNCFAFRIFQTREKWIEEAESNKSSYFPQPKSIALAYLKHRFPSLKTLVFLFLFKQHSLYIRNVFFYSFIFLLNYL